jgi:mRNA interferase MazF
VIRRGDIYVAELSPVVGREQGGRRPVVVVSPAAYNSWPIGMVVVAPITSVDRRLRHHILIGKESGLRGESYVMPEYVRAISQQRLAERPIGAAEPEALDLVEWWIENFTTDHWS